MGVSPKIDGTEVRYWGDKNFLFGQNLFRVQPNCLTFLFFFFPSLQTIMPKIFAILLVQAAVFSPAVAKEGEREIFNLRGKQEEEALRNVR